MQEERYPQHDRMKPKRQPRRPTPAEFIDFRFLGHGTNQHCVLAWLRGQPAFQRADKTFCCSPRFTAFEPGMQDVERIDFAQRVAFCLGRYLTAAESNAWKGASSLERESAARAYKIALQWSRKGFGPYDLEERHRLEALLTVARDYVLGKHLSPGFRLKGGSHYQVGMLIIELLSQLYYFDIPSKSLTSMITDLVSLVYPNINTKTVQRYAKKFRAAIA